MKPTTPPQNNPPPFCVDCRHFMPEPPTPEGVAPTDVPRCHLSQMIEVVYGKKFYPPCIEMRGNGAPCSLEGKYFQQRKSEN
jgi:hypothetical protein